jgi:hypothetical protein
LVVEPRDLALQPPVNLVFQVDEFGLIGFEGDRSVDFGASGRWITFSEKAEAAAEFPSARRKFPSAKFVSGLVGT